ncbi:fimbria/pilus outer membrane usher protein [Persephonella sp.]
MNYFFDESSLVSDFNFNYSEEEKRLIRLNTTLRIEDIKKIRRIEIGDIYSQDNYLNSIVRLGGIRIATDYSLRPDIITYPLPDFAGQTAVPSSVDIFVGNTKVFSKDLKPGPFEIKDIPVISPEGEMTVVIRDVLGREQIIKVPYLTSINLLKEDLSEYSLTAGLIRKNFLLEDFDYTKFVFSGFYRKGITNRFTAGVSSYIQGQDGFNIGLSMNYLFDKFGLLSPILGASYDINTSSTGYRYGIDYSKSFKYLNLRGVMIRNSTDYFQPASVYGKPKDYYNVLLGFKLFNLGNVSFSYIRRTFLDTTNTTNINISYSKSIYNRVNLSMSFNIYDSNEKRKTFRGSISMPLGNNISGKLLYQKNDYQKYYSARISKNNAGEKGLGYTLSADKVDNYSRFTGRFNLSTEMIDLYSHFSYDTSSSNNSLAYRVGAKGNIIYIDGNLFAKRSSYGSFGIVKIEPPIKDVEVISNNRKIGKTDEKGILFVPSLYPYNKNEIRINPESLDMKTYIEKNIYSFVPYREHGYIIKFKAKKMNSIRLKIEFVDDPPPAGTGFYVDGKKVGILGFGGKAFIENITEGKHTVEIDYGYGKCSFKLNIDQSILNKVVPFIGKYKCIPAKDSIIVHKKDTLLEPKNVKKESSEKVKHVETSVKKSQPKINAKSIAATKRTVFKQSKVHNIREYTVNIEQFDEYKEFLEFRERLKLGGK